MTAARWSDRAHEAVAALVGARAGLSFLPNRCAEAEAGIRRGMSKARITDVSDYLRRLVAGEIPLDALIAELTVGETYFFREPAQFEFIRRTVLPDIRKRRGPDRRIGIWSAGCATGEEPYSLAILLEQERLADRSLILATDISRPALARASMAVYDAWSLRGDDGRLAGRYFERRGQRFALADRLRRRVRFDHLNLATDTYPSLASEAAELDLVLCRNVLIHFDRATVRKVARRLVDSLADGGWLITGPSDPPLSAEDGVEVVATPNGLFYRRRRRAPSLPVELPPVPPTAPDAHPVARERSTPPAAPRSPHDQVEQAREALARGDHAQAATLPRDHATDLAACRFRVRAMANLGDTAGAERAAAQAAARHPLSTDLHHLHALMLMRCGRRADAVRAVRRMIYLDRSLAVAHLTLATLLQQCGDLSGALRACRNGLALAAARPPDEVPPLADDETAGRIAAAARRRIASLERSAGAAR